MIKNRLYFNQKTKKTKNKKKKKKENSIAAATMSNKRLSVANALPPAYKSAHIFIKQTAVTTAIHKNHSKDLYTQSRFNKCNVIVGE